VQALLFAIAKGAFMTPARRFVTDEAKVVYLCQQFQPSYMREYLMWTAVWRQDPQNGRGQLPPPVGKSLERGAALFWEILDEEKAQVQAYQAPIIRAKLEALLEEGA
jgi:hypothetical protein